MCGRYAATANPDELVLEFEVDDDRTGEPTRSILVSPQEPPPGRPDHNVAPTKQAPVVLERPPRDDRDAPAADAIAHLEQLVQAVDVEREVLHRAGRGVAPGVAGVRDADDRFGRVVRVLLERDVALGAQLDERVERVRHPVHPVEGLELAAEDIGEELDLSLHVAGRDREVVDAVRVQCHGRSVGPAV